MARTSKVKYYGQTESHFKFPNLFSLTSFRHPLNRHTTGRTISSFLSFHRGSDKSRTIDNSSRKYQTNYFSPTGIRRLGTCMKKISCFPSRRRRHRRGRRTRLRDDNCNSFAPMYVVWPIAAEHCNIITITNNAAADVFISIIISRRTMLPDSTRNIKSTGGYY